MIFVPVILLALSGRAKPPVALPPVIPKPVSMTPASGQGFDVTPATVLSDPSHTSASELLQEMFEKGAGYRLRLTTRRESNDTIRFEKVPASEIRKEGYQLTVRDHGVTIRFSDNGGAVYAVETIRQLLPVAIEGPRPSKARWLIPPVDIVDYPRFSWRGLHLDVSRHFFPPSFIKKYIDYIAMMKGNTFHWHLVDDGGWRLQIDRYPRLTSVGAWRYGVTTNRDQSKLRFDPSSGLPKYGGFYTKAEVRDIVKYAEARNVNIVPEIEMPGHTMPVLAAYPELGCKNQEPSTLPGRPATNVYCAGNEASYTFIENVLDEVMELFPSKWIHIGGDEVDKRFWHACPLCQAKMKQEGLNNEEELQSYFVRRIDKYLESKGRRLIGWDEILEGGLAKGATVMSWRGMDGGEKAAKAGHDVVMSPGSYAYFDSSYQDLPTEHVYTFDPVPPSLDAQEAKHILGGQANIWTERIPTPARAEYMIFPRMAAIAEVLWSPKQGRDLNEFLNRLASLFPRLDQMGAKYYLPAPRVAMSAYLFTQSAIVAAIVTKPMPGSLRYTLDGAPPSSSSPVYKGPFTINKATVVRFAYVDARGGTSDSATVYCRPAQSVMLRNPSPGWAYSYYEGAWKTTPDFAGRSSQGEGVTPKLGVQVRKRDENFALRFTGYFKAERSGIYRFDLSSDDGSWLSIEGAKVIDNDGLHSTKAIDDSIWMPMGWHKIEVGYFQSGGALSLNMAVQTPGSSKWTLADRLVYQGEAVSGG